MRQAEERGRVEGRVEGRAEARVEALAALGVDCAEVDEPALAALPAADFRALLRRAVSAPGASFRALWGR